MNQACRHLRRAAVLPDGTIVEIPADFWRGMSRAEQHANLGRLGAKQCRRLWQLMNLPFDPPRSVEVLFNREDVYRIWPLKKKEKP